MDNFLSWRRFQVDSHLGFRCTPMHTHAHPCSLLIHAHEGTSKLEGFAFRFRSICVFAIAADGFTSIQGLHSGIWYLDIWYVCFLSTPCHKDKSSSISHLETTLYFSLLLQGQETGGGRVRSQNISSPLCLCGIMPDNNNF